MANDNAVVNAILGATKNPQIQAAMLLGSRMESSWNTQSVGDNGTSFGPFQIHLPAHPGVSQAEAEDPTWAVNYMLPAYTAGVAAVPASLWGSNPSLAAATAAFHAERPKVMYSNSVISSDWPLVESALGGNSVAVGSGTPAAGATDASSLTSSVVGPIYVALNNMYMGAIMVLGLGLMSVGAYLLFRDAFKSAAQPINITVKGPNNGNTTQSTTTESRTPQTYRNSSSSSRRPTVRPAIGLTPRPTRASATRVKPANAGASKSRIVNAPKELT